MNSTMIIAGGAALAYYLYTQQEKKPTTTTTTAKPGGTGTTTPTTGTTTTANPTGTTTAPAPVTNTTPDPNGNTLGAIFNRMKAAALAAGEPNGNPDVWNWYLMQVAPSIVAPDPLGVFTTYDRSVGMSLTAEQYWAVMSPYLHTHLGLSGTRRGPARFFHYGGWE